MFRLGSTSTKVAAATATRRTMLRYRPAGIESSAAAAAAASPVATQALESQMQMQTRSFSSTPRSLEKGTSLYTWGTNNSGSLLQGDDANSKIDSKGILWEPHLAACAGDLDSEVAHVWCGHQEILLITKEGTAWVAGENKYGQLGLGHQDPVPALTRVEVDGVDRFVSGKIGMSTGALVAENGDLYTFGFGGSTLKGVGCLGHGDVESYRTPKLVESLVEDGCRVADVTLGESHTAVLTTEGEVLTTGASNYGRLGNAETSEDNLYFDAVEILPTETVAQIAGGESFTLALTEEGIVYGWGKNAKGQLGTGFGMAVDMYAMADVPTPIEGDELSNRKVTKIAAGTNHSACVTSSGELFWWGVNLHLEPYRVAEVLHTKIVDVACGLDYTLALSEDGDVYVWGFGKTGVLGSGPDTTTMHQAKRIPLFLTSSSLDGGDDDDDNTAAAAAAEKESNREIMTLSAGCNLAACLVRE